MFSPTKGATPATALLQHNTARDKEKLAIAEAFLAAVSPLGAHIVNMQSDVTRVVTLCGNVLNVMERSQHDIAELARQAEAIQRERNEAKRRLEEATAVAAELNISAADREVLAQGPAERERFLSALDRAAAVRHRATQLLAEHALDDIHTLAMDALESAVRTEREGMDVLFTWLSSQLSSARHAEALEGLARDTVLCQGLARLAVLRPAHYVACQDAVCRARQSAVFDRFLAEAAYGSRAAVAAAAGGGSGFGHGGGDGGLGSSGTSVLDSVDDGGSAYTSGTVLRGGGGGGGEDQVRTLADVLAWLHLVLAEEGEALASLFTHAASNTSSSSASSASRGGRGGAVPSFTTPRKAPAAAATDEAPSQGQAGAGAGAAADAGTGGASVVTVGAMLDSIAQPLCRPLLRALQRAIASQSSLLVLVRMREVLSFYSLKLHTLLPATSSSSGSSGTTSGLSSSTGTPSQLSQSSSQPQLLAVLQAAQAAATSSFEQVLHLTAARLRSAPPSFPSSLAMTPVMADTALTLKELLSALEPVTADLTSSSTTTVANSGANGSSANNNSSGSSGEVTDAAVVWSAGHVLDTLLPPAISHTLASGDGLPAAQLAMFMLNNLYGLQALLAACAGAATAGWMERLASEAAGYEGSLCEQVAGRVLAETGILRTLNALSSANTSASSSAITDIVPLGTLQSVMSAFTAAALSPAFLSVYDAVSNARVKSSLRRDTGTILAAAYAKLHALLTDAIAAAATGAGNSATAAGVREVLRYSPAQIEEMLELR